VLDFSWNLKRTHYCGNCAPRTKGAMPSDGWVARGAISQFALSGYRDRTGIVQVVFNKETQPAAHAKRAGAQRILVVA